MKLQHVFVLSGISLLALTGSSLSSTPAKIPTNLNDNVVICGVNAHCTNKVMFGRNYKIIDTAKFTVMVSISKEATYTRADVSIENHADYSQNISPEDFRVEVLSPKLKILLYVPPAELKNLPAPPPVVLSPAIAETHPPAHPAATVDVASAAGSVPVPAAVPATPKINKLHLASQREAVLNEAEERAGAQKHLEATAIPSKEIVRGRVYFEKYARGKQVNIVLPVAGLVFEFPYDLK